MSLSMKEKKSVTKTLRVRYQRNRKKEKQVILDEFCFVTGYNRSYGARVLRGKEEKRAKSTKKRARKKIYDQDVLVSLRKIWAILDGICGKRLVAILPQVIPRLERFSEIELSDETREKLGKISASTIDRLLGPERKKMLLRGRSGTKPGTLLKHKIPIRTFAQWDEDMPGFVEIDLVGHDGGSTRGEFAQSLNLTDVYSGWTETRAVKNKAQVWVFEALRNIRGELPFDLLGIDSDNGSEFINDQLFRYCEGEKITFTRTRPYRKNDNCYVEQKNWTIVRRYVGYRRYSSEDETMVMNDLYGNLRLYTNFFLPSVKLIAKTRIGSKVRKQYDDPKTPYQRLLDSTCVCEQAKSKLRSQYMSLNPAQLKRTILRLQDKLYNIHKIKRELNEKEAIKTSSLEYILDESTNTHLEYIFK